VSSSEFKVKQAATLNHKGGIQERAFALALRVLRVVRALPRDTASQIIGRQIARSGTSVGANVEEAQGAHSKAEFARRMNIARSEALETRYWLRLIVEGGMLPKRRLEPLVQEADEVVRTLVAIVKKARGAQI
jgi:four helix bundle protein